MSKKNDGGSAFPSHGSMGEVVDPGMSLRDYFAVHSGITMKDVENRINSSMGNFLELSQEERLSALSQYQYQYADAMIEEREK